MISRVAKFEGLLGIAKILIRIRHWFSTGLHQDLKIGCAATEYKERQKHVFESKIRFPVIRLHSEKCACVTYSEKCHCPPRDGGAGQDMRYKPLYLTAFLLLPSFIIVPKHKGVN